MKCVRCLKDTAKNIAKAPDGSKAWEVYYCDGCNYVWRSSEEEEIIVIEKREPAFQLDKTDTSDLLCTMGIPPLKK